MVPAIDVAWVPPRPLDLLLTLGPLRRGAGDPTLLIGAEGVWRGLQTPDGPATQHLRRNGAEVLARHWGPGATWAAQRVGALLGEGDDADGFDADALHRTSHHPEVPRAWDLMRRRGWRVPASGEVFAALVAAVLEQKVTGLQARRAWRQLHGQHAEPAPVAPGMPPGLMTTLTPAQAARIPSWDWHRAGVDPRRARTIVALCPFGGRIDQCRDLPLDRARARLESFPGIGPWTASEVLQRALGDADAVSFGDLHLPGQVVYALTGDEHGDDEALERVLRPWAGHRYRVVRAVEVSGVTRPRRAPRLSVQDHRGH